MGKEHATTQDVIDSANEVATCSDGLLDANGVDDLVMCAQAVVDSLKHLLGNTKVCYIVKIRWERMEWILHW